MARRARQDQFGQVSEHLICNIAFVYRKFVRIIICVSFTVGIADTFNKLLQLGRFLAVHLFRPDSTPVSGVTCISVLGRIWWPELWRELKGSVLEPSIPDERVMLAKYEALVESAIEFEKDMMALGESFW